MGETTPVEKPSKKPRKHSSASKKNQGKEKASRKNSKTSSGSTLDSQDQPQESTKANETLNSQPQSPFEEKQIIKQILDEHKPANLQKFYVLSMDWWNEWKAYVSFDDKNDTPNSSAVSGRPNPIDNDSLLENGDQLKSALMEGTDYWLLPEKAWKIIFDW